MAGWEMKAGRLDWSGKGPRREGDQGEKQENHEGAKRTDLKACVCVCVCVFIGESRKLLDMCNVRETRAKVV